MAAAVTLTACDDSTGGGGGGYGGGDTRSPTQGGGGQDQPEPLARLNDIPVGDAIKAKDADGQDIILTRSADREVTAFSATCTHKGCTVEPAEVELSCPCHGSTFDKVTGQVRSGPATQPLPKRPVRLQGDQIHPA